MGDRSKPFGGLSIIFAGDFRQLEPNGSTDSDLLFSRQSSGHFESCTNAVIILNNEHRFKDDPELGKMLKQMWADDLSKKRLSIQERLGTMDSSSPKKLELMHAMHVQQMQSATLFGQTTSVSTFLILIHQLNQTRSPHKTQLWLRLIYKVLHQKNASGMLIMSWGTGSWPHVVMLT